MNNYKITYKLKHYTQDPPLFRDYTYYTSSIFSTEKEEIAERLRMYSAVDEETKNSLYLPSGYYWIETLTKEGE